MVKSFKGLLGQTEYETLMRVFEEQYSDFSPQIEQMEGEWKMIAVPREEDEISETSFPRAKSMQNPHDPDYHYRNKNGSGVKGYSINVTSET